MSNNSQMGCSSKYNVVQRPIIEQIEELKAKLALLEGDRKAYYESCFQTLQHCKKRVGELREENKEIRRELHEKLTADEQIISQAFQNRPIERAALNGKTGPEALTRMDHLVCDTMKKLNALRHLTGCKRTRLDELRTQCDTLNNVSVDLAATVAGINMDGQNMRDLENRLDKATLKCNEANHIRKTYERIKEKLEEEHLTFGRTLDTMETEVLRCRKEREELLKVQKDAVESRIAAQNELRHHEELVYAERKRRELEQAALKKEAEEKRLATEKIEKKLNEDDIMDLDSHQQENEFSKCIYGVDSSEKVQTYEEIFRQLREVTGVSQLEEVTSRFEAQVKTHNELQVLLGESRARIMAQKKERAQLERKLEERKLSDENLNNTNANEVQLIMESTNEEKSKIMDLEKEIHRVLSTLLQYRIGIDHCVNKTMCISNQKTSLIGLKCIDSDPDRVLQQIARVRECVLQLMDRLEIYDLHREKKKKRSDESEVLYIPSELYFNNETHITPINVRVKYNRLNTKDNVYDEEDESEDEIEVLSRVLLKKQSQLLVEHKKKKQKAKKKLKKKII